MAHQGNSWQWCLPDFFSVTDFAISPIITHQRANTEKTNVGVARVVQLNAWDFCTITPIVHALILDGKSDMCCL